MKEPTLAESMRFLAEAVHADARSALRSLAAELLAVEALLPQVAAVPGGGVVVVRVLIEVSLLAESLRLVRRQLESRWPNPGDCVLDTTGPDRRSDAAVGRRHG